jgi:WD40 repeat protein
MAGDPCAIHGWGTAQVADFAPDGSRYVLGTSAGLIKLLRGGDDAELVTRPAHAAAVTAIVFSADGAVVASGSLAGEVKVWSADGRLLRALSPFTTAVRALAFSPDGKRLAMGGAAPMTGSTRLLRVLTVDGGQMADVTGHAYDVIRLAFTPDGGTLVSLGQDHTVRTWNATTWAQLTMFRMRTFGIDVRYLYALSADGARVAMTGHVTSDVYILEPTTGMELKSIYTGGSRTALAFSRDGKRLAVSYSSLDGGVNLHDLEATGPLVSVREPAATVLAVSAGAQDVITSSNVDLPSRRRIAGDVRVPLGGPYRSATTGAAISPDGSWLATVDGSSVVVNRLSDGGVVRRLGGGREGAPSYRGLAFLGGAPAPLALVADRRIDVVALPGEAPVAFPGDPFDVGAFSFAADGALLAHGGPTLSLRGRDGVVKRSAEIATGPTVLGFSPAADRLAVGSGDNAVSIWDTATLTSQRSVPAHSRRITAIGFTTDGRAVASAGEDALIKLWRTDDLALLRSFVGHTGVVNDLSLSPDGAVLASAGEDRSVRLWRLADAATLATLRGFTHPVAAVFFSPDGRRVGGASRDGTVRLWCLP